MIYSFQSGYPQVLRDPYAMDLFTPPYLGLDFEWDIRTDRPTILGVSDGHSIVSVPFEAGLPYLRRLLDRAIWTIVGHNVIRAERPLLADSGIDLPLDSFSDTILWHWLTSAHLCKAGGKSLGDEREIDIRGPGFMNIWTMCSLWTDAMCWKFCRDRECGGIPCPKHEPFWYNGLDSYWPVLALPQMIRRAKLIGVDKLYPLHARLSEQFEIMKRAGVYVDREYIIKLRTDFRQAKEKLWAEGQEKPTPDSLPFNPESWQQVKKYFADKFKMKLKDTQEATIRKLAGDRPEIQELQDLLLYKEAGSGPDRWYADKIWNEKSEEWEGYVEDLGNGLGLIHGNITNFTSTGRTASSNPNLQNIEKRRIDRETGEHVGLRMRRAVVAPPGFNLYSADYSNAENLVILHLAGHKAPEGVDLHTWMAGNAGIKETDEISLRLGGLRDASKSISHAQDYLEGIQLKSPETLRSPQLRREVDAGARIVFNDWTFKGSVVTFTGANLARRAFGDASWGNRKRALELGERYMGKTGTFPGIRDLQRRITKQVEETGAVKTPEGYYLNSYDRTNEDRLKTAAAMWGSNPIGHRLKLSLLNIASDKRMTPLIPVHDEHLLMASADYDPKEVAGWIQEAMVFETPEIPGLSVPIKVKVSTPAIVKEITGEAGPANWRDMKRVL